MHPITPTSLDDGDVVILNAAEEHDETDDKEQQTEFDKDELDKQDNDDAEKELSGIKLAVDYESNEAVNENVQGGISEEHKDEDAVIKDVGVVAASSSALDTEKQQTEERDEEEDESPISRIHSEILALTRKISLPEAGLLNLIRATKEAENEAKRQNEAAVASSPSKESMLLRALAEHGSADFSVYGAFRGVSSRDAKQSSTNPSKVSKTPAVGSKAKWQNEEGEKTSTKKESVSTSPRQDRTVTMNSESVAMGEATGQVQTADDLSKTVGKEIDTRLRSEGTSDRDLLGLLHLYLKRSPQCI